MSADKPAFETGAFDPFEMPNVSLQERFRLQQAMGLAALEVSEQKYLLHNITDEMRTRVAAVVWSTNLARPTLIVNVNDKPQYLQVLHDGKTGKFSGVRVMPDADPSVVWLAMSQFMRSGHSINPAEVKFGQTEGFKQRMLPIWTESYQRYQETKSLMPLDMSPLYANPRGGTTASHQQIYRA